MLQITGYIWIFPIFSYLLVGTLAYGSQLLFQHIEPYGLEPSQIIHFNIVVACVFIGYTRSWLTNPGRVPTGWQPSNKAHRSRWCRKCNTFKPARAHHCKTCGRCIPKMDHHCPWTVNCVSHRTLPHFLRFLTFGIWSLVLLDSYLFERLAVIWSNRHLPSYLGPSALVMSGLFMIALTSFITTVCIGILFIRCLWSLFTNVTSIESWEIERHGTLVRRAKTFGGYLDGPNGGRIPIRKQEFPYDIGIWSNLTQVLGTNPLLWLWPLSRTPSSESGLEFQVNDFEDDDHDTIWPPPDPDRMPRTRMNLNGELSMLDDEKSDKERKAAFLVRQAADFNMIGTHRRRRFHERYTEDEDDYEYQAPLSPVEDGEEAWRSSEGERLADFGLDEETEFYDEENVPIAQLLHQRRQND